MEPWLDSLSEDWNSEPRLSSPASSIAYKTRNGTDTSTKSQSRIPHLAQSLRKDSVNGSFIKPRSSRGIAKAKNRPILSERSASSLNLQASTIQDESQKRRISTLPRQASSVFSDSQQSVQHHTVNSMTKLEDTPEWKKRLAKTDEIASDGFDLFSPSKLEGIFAQQNAQKPHKAQQPIVTDSSTNPWSALKLAQLPSSAEQYQSFRTSRSRAPVMEALHEVNEEEEDQDSLSAISSDIVRDGSIRGIVRRRVDSLEQVQPVITNKTIDSRCTSYNTKDPRWRTFSGQQELRNELISPVTVSAKEIIREKALQASVDLDPVALKKKLLDTAASSSRRPSSRSSDRDVSYTGQGRVEDSMLHEEHMPDMTSQSLPEDLSMGTELFVSNGGYVNQKRGAPSADASILRQNSSSAAGGSQVKHTRPNSEQFRSSPPPYNIARDDTFDENDEPDNDSSNLLNTSVVHHDPSPLREPSQGSPLKLFGNRDTYTNNKLMRVLSQFQQNGSDSSGLSEGSVIHEQREQAQSENALRMSQFGKGELDTFNFEKEVAQPKSTSVKDVNDLIVADGDRIFRDLANLSLKDKQSRKSSKHGDHGGDLEAESHVKRLINSPAKDRTPKRRRTLLKDEIVVEGVGVEIKIDQVPDKMTAVAGKKRKDARPGEEGSLADEAVLASRNILRPKVGSRKSSAASQPRSTSQSTVIAHTEAQPGLAEALAAELESFAQGVSAAKQDSRKPSLATKDYMEEANKVMEFIRARGKPKAQLPEIHEPTELSELNPDSVLDLELDDDSTKDSFSRPPSRERSTKPREDRRVAKHDPRIASHLRKFQEPDDLEILASTSIINTLPPIDNLAADEAALVPVPEEEQESSPPNIRIRGHDDNIRKRKHSGSTANGQHTVTHSDNSSTGRTFATGSTDTSGRKGMITSGTVSIPDQVGTMTFDHEQQVWVKQQLINHRLKRGELENAPSHAREVTLDDDPFDSIPDLSIDEQREEAMKVVPKSSAVPAATDMLLDTCPTEHHTAGFPADSQLNSPKPSSLSPALHKDRIADENHHELGEGIDHHAPDAQASLRSEVSRHEERLLDGLPSKGPTTPETSKRQARVVTIAFSSPIASEIPYKKPISISDDDDFDNDDDFLPPEDSDVEDDKYDTPPKSTKSTTTTKPIDNNLRTSTHTTRHEQYRSMTLDRRPVSRIEERDEDSPTKDGMSLVHVTQVAEPIPASRDHLAAPDQTPAYKGTSILCLTPLSEFTMHQVDKANNPDESFVAARAHPKALLQAHGSLNLAVDALVGAITDAVSTEPFWEQLRSLNLSDKRLTSLHRLQDYCPLLEELILHNNSVGQLHGLPPMIRQLDVKANCINDLTSWGSLQNLQYVDVSENQLESLEAFSSLVHLRGLKACNNKIRDIEGVLDLDGLISLDLSGNELTSVDFEGVELPRLESLDLSKNRLTTIRNLHFLPQLKVLKLDMNSLREVFVAEPMLYLKKLSVAHNEIDNFDLNMFPVLEVLDIDDNCLTTLQGLSSAEKLRKLSLREQRQSPGIVNFILTTQNECSEILLSSNILTDGTIELPKYPHYNLRVLELAACGLKEVPQGFGDYFPNCRTLNFNFNAMQDLGPLMGCIKLRTLLLAGNRIKRLRRTCLMVARLPSIQRLDIRDNPLTVGFYAPTQTPDCNLSSNTLPRRASMQDVKWTLTLDETTALRRRMIELLLAEQCNHLIELDGQDFKASDVLRTDYVWSSLTGKGVLVKAIAAAPVSTVEVAATADTEKEDLPTCVDATIDANGLL